MSPRVLRLAFIPLALSIFGLACGSSSADIPAPVVPDEAGVAVDAGVADSADSAAPADAGSDAAESSPIVAPADSWTWVDFPDSKCASGTATGIGVNPHAGADDVLIYLEGGGACASADSCWGPTPEAANVAGYDATVFASAKQRDYPALSRALGANPFQALNMVYVPYCTGDMHAGTKETDLVVNGVTKPTYFWGARDLDIFLARLAPTFPAAKHIWLLGTSAGGFGTVLTYAQVVSAFKTRVDILDDSGPSIVAKSATDNAGSFTAWGFVPPSGCTGCTSHASVLAFDRALQPQSRYAFLSFSQDTVISKDFGYTLDEYPGVLDAFFASSLASDPNAKTFVVTTKQSHVVESDPASAITYLPWMTKMANDDPSWASESH